MRLLQIGWLIFTLFVTPGVSLAELWQVTPEVSLQEKYIENAQMSKEPTGSVYETVLKGVLDFSRLSETSSITGQVHLDFRKYNSDENSLKDNQYFILRSQKKYERNQIGLNGFFRRDSTFRTLQVASQGETENDEGVQDIDEGLTQLELKRNTMRLEPFTNFQYSERAMISLNYSYVGARYENNNLQTGVYDFDQNGITTMFSRFLTERDVFITGLGFSQYDAGDKTKTRVRNFEGSIGYRRALSEKSVGKAFLGVRRSTKESASISTDDMGFIARVSLDYRAEVGRYRAYVAHDLQPSGAGNLLETNQAKVELSHNFRPKITGMVSAWLYSSTPIGVVTSSTPYFLNLEPRLEWRLSRWWVAGGGYRYRRREDLGGSNDADSNIVFISIKYSKVMTID